MDDATRFAKKRLRRLEAEARVRRQQPPLGDFSHVERSEIKRLRKEIPEKIQMALWLLREREYRDFEPTLVEIPSVWRLGGRKVVAAWDLAQWSITDPTGDNSIPYEWRSVLLADGRIAVQGNSSPFTVQVLRHGSYEDLRTTNNGLDVLISRLL